MNVFHVELKKIFHYTMKYTQRKKKLKRKNLSKRVKKKTKKNSKKRTVGTNPKILNSRLNLLKENHDYTSLSLSIQYMIKIINILKKKPIRYDDIDYINDINKNFGRTLTRRAETFYTMIFSDELKLNRKKNTPIYQEMIPKYIDEHLLPLLRQTRPVNLNNKIFIPYDVYNEYEQIIQNYNKEGTIFLPNIFTDE